AKERVGLTQPRSAQVRRLPRRCEGDECLYKMVEHQTHASTSALVFVHGDPKIDLDAILVGKDGNQVRITARNDSRTDANAKACPERRKLSERAVRSKGERFAHHRRRRIAQRTDVHHPLVEADQRMSAERVDGLWHTMTIQVRTMGVESELDL